jgi:hypothetical protein
MSRSIRTRRNRTVNTQEQEAGQDTGFFQKKQEPGFFEPNHTIQRLSTPDDEQEPATNDARMEQDKKIQRCACEDDAKEGKAPAVSKKIQRNMVPLVVLEPRRVGSGSAKMGPGISVSWNGNSMAITGHLEISGPAATAAIAAQIQSTINSHWNQNFADGYSVSCNVDVTYRAPDVAEDGSRTQINIVNGSGYSYVSNRWLLGARYMSLNIAEADLNWTPAHEFGHLIGIPDHYSEGIVSKVSGFFGGKRSTTKDAGWEGNIMTETGGKVESKNIAEWLKLHGVQYVMPGTATPQEA